MLGLQVTDDLAELWERHRRVDRTVVNLQVVDKWLKQQVVVDHVRVRKDERGRNRRVLVQVMKPVN